MIKAMSWRQAVLGSVAVLPFLCGTAALAADAPKSGDEVGEVVVTATRRTQNLSKVPESVSAFTAAKMEVLNVKSFADLAKYTPGVTFDNDRHDVSIRGVDSKGGSGTTGIYIDDTPIQMRALGLNANNTLPTVFDLQRVEVLRGPQGTLFGAGSEGGTVRYITTQPSLTAFSANAHAELATTDGGDPSYEFGVAAGGPIVKDVLGFRASAWGRRDGGWVTRNNVGDTGQVENDANFTDTYVLRAALTWAPTPRLSITPSINYEKRDQHNHDEYWVGVSNPSEGIFLSGTPDRMADPDRFYMPTVKIEYDGGAVKIISNTSYYDRLERVNGYSGTLYNLSYFEHFTGNTDPDPVDDGALNTPGAALNPVDPQLNPPPGCATIAPGHPGCIIGNLLTPTGLSLPGFGPYVSENLIINSQKNFTQEVRLQSNDPKARFSWVVGAFYDFNTQVSTEEIIDPQLGDLSKYLWGDPGPGVDPVLFYWGEPLLPGGVDYINDTHAHDRQIALFGEATYNITDALKVTAGFRYAWTHFDFHNTNDGPQDCASTGCTPKSPQGGKDETPFTPKISVSYQINPNDMIYGTISKGYRIGGASPPLPAACFNQPSAQYGSDTLLNYEVGTKDRFLDRKFYIAASAFYDEWQNIQQAVYVQSCGIQYTTNTGSAISQGFDLDGQWQITQGLNLEFSVGYTDAHYTGVDFDKTTGLQLTSKGDVLNVAPWTVTFGAQYDFTVADHPGFVRADVEYESKRTKPDVYEDPANTGNFVSGLVPDPATTQVSMRAGMTFNNVDMALFVDNLLNAHPQLNLQHEDGTTALFEATTFRPRTVGISASYKY